MIARLSPLPVRGLVGEWARGRSCCHGRMAALAMLTSPRFSSPNCYAIPHSSRPRRTIAARNAVRHGTTSPHRGRGQTRPREALHSEARLRSVSRPVSPGCRRRVRFRWPWLWACTSCLRSLPLHCTVCGFSTWARRGEQSRSDSLAPPEPTRPALLPHHIPPAAARGSWP